MFSYYKTLVIFSVLYNLSVQLILYIIICTSTPVLSLLLFLSPPVTINLFSVSVNLSLYYYIHQLVVFFRFYIYVMGFPGSSSGKESTCNTGDPGLIPGLGRSPGEGNGSLWTEEPSRLLLTSWSINQQHKRQEYTVEKRHVSHSCCLLTTRQLWSCYKALLYVSEPYWDLA